MVEQLGEGGMAAVYRAFDQRLQVWRAIKILLPQYADKPKIARRFEAEAQTMALLEHRNIVRVYDVGTDGSNIAYIVMELVEGGCLVDWLEHHGPMPARMAVRATQEVCMGLSAAHEKGIVHRDVKPHNVMVTRDGVCRVTDFGIARVGDAQNSQTKTGSVMGTWGYMAPEQRTNAKGVDERGDVYAVGATLYTLLTDRMPMDLFAADRNATILEGIHEALIPVLIKSTEYDREDRYPNVMALHAALEEVFEQLPEIPEGTAPLALNAVRVATPPDPTKFVPATEVGEGGRPVANPTLLPQGENTQLKSDPASQETIAPNDEALAAYRAEAEGYDPAKGPNPAYDLNSAATIMRPEPAISYTATPIPQERDLSLNAPPQQSTIWGMATGAFMAVWGLVGVIVLVVLVIWVAFPRDNVVVQPTAAPEPVTKVEPRPDPVEPIPTPVPDVVDPTPSGPKPGGPKPQPVGPKPADPQPAVPQPADPQPVAVVPVPVPQPVEPVVPVPDPEPTVVKCVKLASPVDWNSSKSGVMFKFKQCEGPFPTTNNRVVLNYRIKGEGDYKGQPLGVASQTWSWRMPAELATGKIEWYVDGDMGPIGSAGKPQVFVP